jgi:hypothetical protein
MKLSALRLKRLSTLNWVPAAAFTEFYLQSGLGQFFNYRRGIRFFSRSGIDQQIQHSDILEGKSKRLFSYAFKC